MKLANMIVSVILGGAGLYFICAQTHWTVALGMILFTWSNNIDIMSRFKKIDDNEKLADDMKKAALDVIIRERRDGGLLAPTIINNTTINGGQ